MTIEKEFSSIRFITALTPDTFTRKIIIISTVFRSSDKTGETAMRQESGLNYFDINYNKGSDWVKMKKHHSLKEAREFHDKLASKQRFVDCELEGATIPVKENVV
jgi:hypothetical protein